MTTPTRPTGLTADAGWQMGVRRTVPADLTDTWHYLVGEGLPVWLGDTTTLPTERHAAYSTADGVTGEVRGYTEYRRIRLTWRPRDLDHDTTLQITLIPAATGTTVAFHQERLRDAAEREAMLAHWREVAGRIDRALRPSRSGG
ncbi:activator of Hsp90 ATPase-like protein [Stackebrandtia albiflava]|uniref:Activator of Hsp90 ATPase-like protein n=1 Tax=Stackebrandtia albiflava TaxID=406432 RepID=A0A562V2I5_9ACTN|nr:SRPBCC domain-containing protein [Stackebrandtia albiflava]TWJ12078.1 activator of Hsp90 ATPase-like protein [Stackebrandtia albiflava]